MPEALGFLILDAVGASTIAGFAVTASTATIVGDVALAGVAIGASLLNRPGAPKPQDGQQTVQQSSAPRIRNYGVVKVGGAVLFSEVSSGQRVQVLAINQGEISAYLEYYYDENEVVLGPGGIVSALNFNYYRIGTHTYTAIKTTFGTDDDPVLQDLLALFPSLWTTAHQGKGIAKVETYMQTPGSKDFTTVYPGGAAPIFRAVIAACLVWDPRDPAQNRNDKTTWQFNQNPVLQALDYHRHADGMGLAVFDSIFFTDAAIAEDWIPAANICDDQIPLKQGGTANRYVCAGGYQLSASPKTVLASIFSSCDGQTYQRADGAIGIRVGKTIAPTVTLGDDDIVGYDSLRRGPTDSLVPVNQVTAKYTASAFDFQENDSEPWVDQAAIAAAGGRVESRDIDLHWVNVFPQARRLQKLALHRFTPEWTGKIITNLGGLRAWSERYIHIHLTELEIDGDFEVTSFDIDTAGLTCTIGISSMDQSALDWNPAIEEGSETEPPDQNTDENTIDDPVSVSASASGHILTITWAAPIPDQAFVTPQAQYSVHGSGNWFDAAVNDTTNTAVSPVLPAGSYDVQVSFVSGTLRSNWVPLLAIAV